MDIRINVLYFVTLLVSGSGVEDCSDDSCSPKTSGNTLLQKRVEQQRATVDEEDESGENDNGADAGVAEEKKWWLFADEATDDSTSDDGASDDRTSLSPKEQKAEEKEKAAAEKSTKSAAAREASQAKAEANRLAKEAKGEEKDKAVAEKNEKSTAAAEARGAAADERAAAKMLKAKQQAEDRQAMAKAAQERKARQEFCKENKMDCFENRTVVHGAVFAGAKNVDQLLHDDATVLGIRDGIADLHGIPREDVSVVTEWVNVSELPEGSVAAGTNVAVRAAYEIIVPEDETAEGVIALMPKHDEVIKALLNAAQRRDKGELLDSVETTQLAHEEEIVDDGLVDHIQMEIPFPGIKKGACLGFPVGKQCSDVAAYGGSIGWFYTWRPNVSKYAKWDTPECRKVLKGGNFVPMIQNGDDMNKETFQSVYVGSDYLLAFNEPYGPTTDMTPSQAAKGLVKIVKLKERLEKESGRRVQLGSPSVNPKEESMVWFREFMKLADKMGIQFDFVSVHCYQMDIWGLQKGLNSIWNEFKHPLWLTEFNYGDGPANANAEQHLAHMKVILPMLEAHPKVVRYSWMASRGPDTGAHLVNDQGLTALGKFYTEFNKYENLRILASQPGMRGEPESLGNDDYYYYGSSADSDSSYSYDYDDNAPANSDYYG